MSFRNVFSKTVRGSRDFVRGVQRSGARKVFKGFERTWQSLPKVLSDVFRHVQEFPMMLQGPCRAYRVLCYDVASIRVVVVKLFNGLMGMI